MTLPNAVGTLLASQPTASQSATADFVAACHLRRGFIRWLASFASRRLGASVGASAGHESVSAVTPTYPSQTRLSNPVRQDTTIAHSGALLDTTLLDFRGLK